jgi:YkoY family integral membrane protein
MLLAIFGQTFHATDFALIGLLIVLEGVLSIDNALVLGVLAKRLPEHQQKRALTYGLVGAFAFRILAILMASLLLKWHFVKLLGGGYLLYIALKHFWDMRKSGKEEAEAVALGEPVITTVQYAKFWPTVAVIELTDIAFAVDSILAAIGVVGSPPAGTPPDAFHPKLWVVIVGGILGVILMRFAAVLFIQLLKRFPRFEMAAYLLVAVIGLKLLVDYVGNNLLTTDGSHPIDFHSPNNLWFWGFWVSMGLCIAIGFMGSRKPSALVADESAIRH